MDCMIGGYVGGGRRVVDTTHRTMVLSRQSQVDGTSVPASVRRPVYTQDARDMYRTQPYRPGTSVPASVRRPVYTQDPRDMYRTQQYRPGTSVPASVRRPVYTQDPRDMYRTQPYRPGPQLPPIPRPGYDDRYHGRPLPILPGRLTFPCTYARRFPPGHHLPPPSLHVDMHIKRRSTPLVPSGQNKAETLKTVEKPNKKKDKELVAMNKKEALKRVEKLRKRKGQELVAMSKVEALKRVEKLRKKKGQELVAMSKADALKRVEKLRKKKGQELVAMSKADALKRVEKLRKIKGQELVAMSKADALKRVEKLRKKKGQELVAMSKADALKRVEKLRKKKGKELVAMNKTEALKRVEQLRKKKGKELVAMSKTEALKRVEKLRRKKRQERILMDKAVALRSQEKLKNRKGELIRQGNIPERTYSSIYDFINEKMREMFAVTLNNIRQDIIELNKILQYKIEVRDERDHVAVQSTGVVLNLHRDNLNMKSIERLIRSANNSDHTYVQEDWRKINERQKHRTGIIKIMKLKMRRLKKLCINGSIRYSDDTQVMNNLIRSLNENYKSIKVVRDVFITQCIDTSRNDLELIKQLEKDVHEFTEEPLDHETLARIQRFVSRINVKTNAENALITGSNIVRKTDNKVSHIASDSRRKLSRRRVNIGKH